MDPNLTCPAVLNASINATLMSPSNSINDWMPSIITIFAVILSSFLSYRYAIKIAKQNREYELKKEVYIGVLDSLIEIRNGLQDYFSKSNPFVQKPNYNPWEWTPKQTDSEMQKPKLRDLMDLLELRKAQLFICANDKINFIYDSAMMEFRKIMFAMNDRDRSMYLDKFESLYVMDLIPALKADLYTTKKQGKKRWWQFRK